MSGPASPGRRLWLIAAAAWLSPRVSNAAPQGSRAGAEERRWLERSASLADAARQHAAVADFRGRIEEHREQLRRIVRSDDGNAAPAVLQLHRSMILVNALLHAAAECQVSGRLMCPADLMRQLDQQIAAGFVQVSAVEKAPR